MKKLSFQILLALGFVFVTMFSGIASAQTTDVFWTNYFSNNAATGYSDATIRITNPGVQGGAKGNSSAGALCAMIYVFSSDQQMNECCGCLVTPNGLQTDSLKFGLTANSLTGHMPYNGVIQIISSAPNSSSSPTGAGSQPGYNNNSPLCDPTSGVMPKPDIRAWVTHIQNKYGATYPVTEEEFLPAPLSASELGTVQGDCNFAVTQGSGQGVCNCGFFEK